MADSRAQQATTSSVQDLTGTCVDRFEIRQRLGAGGMGEVYLAEDTLLKRRVALKRMSNELRSDPYYRKRFMQEAEGASRITDPHIASVYDVLEENGELYLVMEYVEGEPLRKRIGQPMDPQTFLPIAIYCAKALAAAHAKDLVHCDIKPENIMLTPAGQVKILDFGVARKLPASDAPTKASIEETIERLGGTVAYMAPEMLLERRADERTDLFSLGVVFYEALAGRHPFRGATYVATWNNILHATPGPLSETNPAVTPELERIVQKLLAKDPAVRYASAKDLLADLSSGPKPEPLTLTLWRQFQRRPMVCMLLLAIMVAAVAFGVNRLMKPLVFSARDWVVIADVENGTQQMLFEHTVDELLRSALRQSRYVNVVPREQLMDAARRAGRKENELDRVDAVLGREICQRDGYRAVLASRVEESGGGFRISVDVQDPRRGVAVVSVSEPFAVASDVYVAVDRVTRKLRGGLGESLAQIEQDSKPLAKVTTPSLAALQRYSRAVRAYAQGDFLRCISLAESAIDLDPDFAMAHFYLANAYLRLGNLKARREHIARAVKGVERVTERERYLIFGLDYSIHGLYEKAAEQFRKLTEFYPDDIQGYRELADALVWKGRLEEAIKAGGQVLELDPRSPLDNARMMNYLIRANQFGEALERFRWCEARSIRSTQINWRAGLAYLGAGDIEAARREFDRLAHLESDDSDYARNIANLYSARVLMYEGRLSEAASELRTGMILDLKLGSLNWTPVRRYLLGRIESLRGASTEARSEVRQLVQEAQGSREAEKLRRAGLLAVELGDFLSASKMVTQLDRLRQEQESSFTQSCYFNLKGSIELRNGQAGKSAESQKAATVYFPNADAQLGLADALAARGEWHEAVNGYEQYLHQKGAILTDEVSADWVIAHLKMARVHARSGNRQEALRYYDLFLKLWVKADANLTLLREARREREGLTVSNPRSP